ncbi:MAG: Flp pilus assembly complex ATPase component TadA [Opitutus sp.]|nr:Flp pilus assembly complex ATPase component TadA [Opitutus sp.]MCS6247631.1 Flp pilus assembly complex ATPase component TadA [Opitutus sp.]MCS6275015.1 Flp pilus assembly complex ATPase component TadA [Opitutus sp.]MCS6278998.1 Flp pilus assembly complex ATPase component TadA [Opitutus sp.]MCS6298747.1 Flp pilus assembly complex ATPase component TadA [Opitutus sp.]
MTSSDDFVLQLAVDKGVLTKSQINAASVQLASHSNPNIAPPSLVEALIASRVVEARQLSKLLADEFGMPLVDLPALRVPNVEAMALVSRAFATRYNVFPISREGGVLKLAIADPLDVDAIDSLSHVIKLTIEPSVAPAGDIKHAITRFYGKDADGLNAMLDDFSIGGAEAVAVSTVPVAGMANVEDGDAPIIKLVHQIILEAIQRRASDIHLEPLEKRFRVRYRIDGVLVEVESPPKRLQLSMISRLKIMANISIAEKRIPQDGRIQINTSAKQIDLRVSSLPTAHGESIVMRILDKDGLQLGLPELGFFSDDQAIVERLIALPDGIMLVTGPTGSGKTTTLYSCLHFINKSDRKIITVEDPVEYQLAGINQVPVRHDVGMTFASALRAMLRQAPNIVMVGEIRDLETAEIAINASLTGHMVFSTLHTNDAPGAITRLIDIGVKPFLVSTSLRAAVAQRLVRKICKQCKKAFTPDANELRSLNITPQQAASATFMRGEGCQNCNGTGYRGRNGIFEMFVVNEEIQRMIYENVGTAKLRDKARSLGMRTMREDGVRKVLAGQSTIDEVVSITVGDAS